MRGLIYFLPVFIIPSFASVQPENICNDLELNRRWEQAVADRPQNRLVIKLSSKRTELCKAVQNGRLDPKLARAMWEKAMMDALLASLPTTQEKQRHDLLMLFANFIF